MPNNAFFPADILLPADSDMTKWSVIACDQFSSEPGYWARVEDFVGAAPSTLRLIVPEAYLDRVDTAKSAEEIARRMEDYLAERLLNKLDDSFIYIERTMTGSAVRRGLVGMLDLEAYDFTPGAKTLVRASERTIISRLPARIDVRRRAPLELPHIMALIDDRACGVIEPLSEITSRLDQVYDFALMEGGGTIRGWRITGDDARDVEAALGCLTGDSGVQIIIGDGNHSLAAAKTYWDEIKTAVSATEREKHPARFALVELNNVYDPAIQFEAIHRVVTHVEPASFLEALGSALPSSKDGYTLRWVSAGGSGDLTVAAGSIGEFIEKLQTFLDDYVSKTGCGIDYIHDDDALINLSAESGSVGLLMPAMDKSEFFKTVAGGAIFPKKSFSIGHAQDKRYYLECRAITNADL